MIGIDVEDESLNQRPSEDVLLDSSEKAKYYRTRLMLLLKGYINENKKEGLRSYAEHLTVKNATKKRVIPNTTDLCYDLPSSSSDVELLGKSSMGGKKKKYNLFRGKKKCASERLKTYGTFNNNNDNDNDDNININVNADTNSSLSPKASSIQDKRLMMIRSNYLSTSKGNIKGSFDVLSDDEYLKSQTLSTKELMYVLEKNNKRIKGVATIETESMFPELQLELHDLEQGVVVKEMGEFRTNILPEVKRIVSNSIPLIFASICQFVMVFVETSTIGNLGKKELGGYGLGHIFLVFLGLPALVGLSGALETLCSQSTTGKENVKLNEHYQHIINEDVEEVADVIAINIGYSDFYITCNRSLHVLGDFFQGAHRDVCKRSGNSSLCTALSEVLYSNLFFAGDKFIIKTIYVCKGRVGAAYYYVWSKSGLNLGFVGVPLAMASGNLAMVFALSYIVYRLILKDKKREYFNGTGHQMENCATENCEMCRIIPPIPVLFQGWGQIFKLTIPGMIVMLATAGTNELISNGKCTGLVPTLFGKIYLRCFIYSLLFYLGCGGYIRDA
ncbi:Ethionine resistance-conferring protein 1 [Zancudomyces culisetae]|uniref:Ethionine resistance-conferring protein 1 n=1 Tax=Zancudomyces culisetae TaxID=1213189 RepID=A0A1R1PZ24_ZANCU|nr:Ethionine resistance-conferring protein 1 [Zancudomyces culisetae]|eukprot:OMH86222.1 Ethionine resistance-conferring protein 1 [Zancudomyces culisetae]